MDGFNWRRDGSMRRDRGGRRGRGERQETRESAGCCSFRGGMWRECRVRAEYLEQNSRADTDRQTEGEV